MRWFVLTLLCSVLLACASKAPPPSTSPADESAAAAELAESGDFDAAARRYRAQASEEPARRVHWLLMALEMTHQGDGSLAMELVRELEGLELTPRERARLRLFQAMSAEDDQPPSERLAALEFPVALLPPRLRTDYYLLQARAYSQSRQHWLAAEARQQALDRAPAEQRGELHRQILAELGQMPQARANATMARVGAKHPLYPYLDFVVSLREAAFTGEAVGQAMAAWRDRHRGHPLSRLNLNSVARSYEVQRRAPEAVALLLPLSGRYANAAARIRDGFLAAYYLDPSPNRARIAILDTRGEAEAARGAYRTAVEAGATQIVGPLERAAVQSLAEDTSAQVPVLALNRATAATAGRPEFFEFGLPAEAEATAVAERMYADGRRRVITLVSDDAWGERLGRAFADRFEALGGTLLQRALYPAESRDFSDIIRGLVGLAEGEARKRRLERDLGQNLAYAPQARQDLDALFIAARADTARLIRPQLEFNYAGTLPVYATSHVFEGRTDTTRDRDLDGIAFCDAPWLINTETHSPSLTQMQQRFDLDGSGARLFALGMDAYRVLPYLQWLQNFPGETYPGLTGALHVTAQGHLERDLACAQFRSGRPVALAPR